MTPEWLFDPVTIAVIALFALVALACGWVARWRGFYVVTYLIAVVMIGAAIGFARLQDAETGFMVVFAGLAGSLAQWTIDRARAQRQREPDQKAPAASS